MSDLINRFAPDFSLPSVNAQRTVLTDLRGSIVVLTFWSADCAWSKRADVMLVYRMVPWEAKGVRVLGIASNTSESETQIRLEVENRGVKYPVLLDVDQTVANAYKARTTPHFFVIDRRGTVRYAGAPDDATFTQVRPHVLYLDKAVNALLENRAPEPAVTTPYGSDIVRPAPPPDKPTTQPRLAGQT
jgi:peroxiredoxin